MLGIQDGKADANSFMSWNDYSHFVTNNYYVYIEEFQDIYEMAPSER